MRGLMNYHHLKVNGASRLLRGEKVGMGRGGVQINEPFFVTF